ncbi:MAG TPA: response regulator [Thermoanaerobaculia bacterium]|nr:response regulator [Thermoanaerobaculia bacterium]
MRDHRPSVLLVDDDPAIRSLLRLLLEQDGCRIDEASDGEKALKKLKRNHYTTILLDLLMPHVNGFEVLQDLRALHPEKLSRVVVFTAASDETLMDFPDEKRIFRLLRKPLDKAEVLRVVRSCAARHTGARQKSRVASVSP